MTTKKTKQKKAAGSVEKTGVGRYEITFNLDAPVEPKPLDWWGAWCPTADLHEIVRCLLEEDSKLPDPHLGRIILHIARAKREALDYFIARAEQDQKREESA